MQWLNEDVTCAELAKGKNIQSGGGQKARSKNSRKVLVPTIGWKQNEVVPANRSAWCSIKEKS